jgi:hypothetical protein
MNSRILRSSSDMLAKQSRLGQIYHFKTSLSSYRVKDNTALGDVVRYYEHLLAKCRAMLSLEAYPQHVLSIAYRALLGEGKNNRLVTIFSFASLQKASSTRKKKTNMWSSAVGLVSRILHIDFLLRLPWYLCLQPPVTNLCNEF